MSYTFKPTLNDKISLSSVSRWHILDTSKNQSVAEHTYNVVIIVRDIINRFNLNIDGGVRIDEASAIRLALEHDLDEVIIGDIPTPTRKLMGDVAQANLDRVMQPPVHWGDDIDTVIVKCADKIEACWFISNFALGKRSIKIGGDIIRHTRHFLSEGDEDIDPSISEIYKISAQILVDILGVGYTSTCEIYKGAQK